MNYCFRTQTYTHAHAHARAQRYALMHALTLAYTAVYILLVVGCHVFAWQYSSIPLLISACCALGILIYDNTRLLWRSFIGLHNLVAKPCKKLAVGSSDYGI